MPERRPEAVGTGHVELALKDDGGSGAVLLGLDTQVVALQVVAL
jgi:hypothetical protein